MDESFAKKTDKDDALYILQYTLTQINKAGKYVLIYFCQRVHKIIYL